MTWKDLNPQNILEVKLLYLDYLRGKSDSLIRMSFEDFFEHIEQCSMCGEYELRHRMIDTEGLIEGGLGLICQSCRGDM